MLLRVGGGAAGIDLQAILRCYSMGSMPPLLWYQVVAGPIVHGGWV